MNTQDYFSHTGLDGSDAGQRITAAGYQWCVWGENIAEGYSSEQIVMNPWLGSEGHCKNIMNGGFKDREQAVRVTTGHRILVQNNF